MKTILLVLSLHAFVFAAAAQNADSASWYFNKGIEDKNAGRLAVAEKNFNKSAELKPDYVEAYVEAGKADLEMRKIYDAQKNFTKAYELAPSNPEVIKQMAQLYFNNRQFQKAIEFALKCNACPEAERIIGMSYYQTENYGNAEAYLKKALTKNNKDAEAAYTLGRTYLELENEKNAIPQFENAIAIDPTKNVWMYELGLIYYSQENYKSALKYFNMATDAGYNKTNDFYENFGFAQIYTGDTDNGVKTLTEVLNRKPNNKELLNNMANAMYETKRYDDALAYFSKLLELDPKDASSLFMAGMTFQKKGEKEKGQKICDKAIEMDPSLARNRQKKDIPMGL
ncbi:MAG: tetratricopeptide repeat protein [Ginsengibacter sp.]